MEFILFQSETNLLRHFSCEQCDGYVKGGFDPSTNQVQLSKNPNTFLSSPAR
jgi:hypothetical protein